MEPIRLQSVTDEQVADLNALLEELSPGHERLTESAARATIENKNAEVWVIQDGGHLIGMGMVIIMPELSGRAAEIDDIVVSAAYRGRGLGTIIMRKLIERAKEHGAQHVDLTSRPARVEANALYQKLGFEKRETNVYRMRV